MNTISFTKLESSIIELLACSFCKSSLDLSEKSAECKTCGTSFDSMSINTGKKNESIFDFKIRYPKEFIPEGYEKWSELQVEFEEFHDHYNDLDNKKVYLDEIDSVKEIYEEEFPLKGKILDVGGNQGRLRHYLDLNSKENDYLSIDPYINVFENVAQYSTLLQSYPCLSEPCNFISGSAENLPIKSESFDWVHMRSVVDHFENPFFALKEAYRVLKPGGSILIGLAIEEKGLDEPLFKRISNKISNEGVSSLKKAITRRLKGLAKGHHDDHMFRFDDKDLLSLLERCGFKIEKTHWQKPPFSYCIYVSAKKVSN